MGWLLGTSLGRNLLACGAVLLALLGLLAALMRSSRKAERQRLELDALRGAIEAHRRMNNADVSVGDHDADREWLRDRASRGSRRSGSPSKTH